MLQDNKYEAEKILINKKNATFIVLTKIVWQHLRFFRFKIAKNTM